MASQEEKFLPYGRQHVAPEDVEAVVKVLKSDWLTQGPDIEAFEEGLARSTGADQVIVCANGTAALHLAMLALEVGPGDRVITSANTFLADANCARYVGAGVAFADVDPNSGNVTPETIEPCLSAAKPGSRQVVIPVHFAGQPVDLPGIAELAGKHDALVVDDGCHALGASYLHGDRDHKIGCGDHSQMTVFSFHPVKHVACGEGGAVATNDPDLAARLRRMRNHGMTKANFTQREMALDSRGEPNPWYYEMKEAGFNYRLTDMQAALGLSQLDRLDWSVRRRNELAFCYHRLIEQLFNSEGLKPLTSRDNLIHAYHLFVALIDFDRFGIDRATVMRKLRDKGIGTQVHYIPVPLQPYYRQLLGAKPGDYPGAEAYYSQALSLPMYPDLIDDDLQRVMETLHEILGVGR